MTDTTIKTTPGDGLKVMLQTFGLNEENAENIRQLFELEVEQVEEQLNERFDARIDEHVTKINAGLDEYLDHVLSEGIAEVVNESVEELRNLMLLSVSTVAGPEKAMEFVRKVGALARAGALSSASGDWASGADDDSAKNRQSIAGGGTSKPVGRNEEVEENDGLKVEAAEVFSEASAGLLAEDVERFKSLAGNVEFDGDVDDLAVRLKFIRESYFGVASQVAPYVRAIARSVRK
jgi:hypothetical protein